MTEPRKDLPSPSAPNYAQRVRETLMTYMGKQGDKLDRGITLRDLLATGLAKFPVGFNAANIGNETPPLIAGPSSSAPYEPDLAPPPTPSGFSVDSAISNIFINHDSPIFFQGHGYLRTNVYGAIYTGGDFPVFGNAVRITQFTGSTFAHPSNPSTTWHLWIKWESNDNVESPPAGGTNGLVTTTGQDVSLLLKALTGKLKESQLFSELGARINLIDGPSSTGGTVAARILAEAQARGAAITTEVNERQSANESLASRIDTVTASTENNSSAIQSEATARADADSSEARLRTTLASQVNDATTGLPATRVTLVNDYYTKTTVDSAIASSSSTVSAAYKAADSDGLTNARNYSDAVVQNEATARSSADGANANSINTVQARLNTGDYAAVKTESSASASAVNGLSAQYTVKVDTNGYVSGYGLANTVVDGTPTSEFIIRADQFAIAPVSTSNTASDGSPFFYRTIPTTINGVTVPAGAYMKAAFIHDATITNAKIANLAVDNAKIANLDVSKLIAGSIAVGQYIQSSSYAAGSSGWRIHSDGSAELSNVKVRGEINTGSFNGYSWPSNGGGGAHLSASGLLVGNANTGKYFQVTSDGNLYSPGFRVENGSLTINQANVINTLNLAGQAVTIPVGAHTASTLALARATYTTTQSISWISTGTPVFLTTTHQVNSMESTSHFIIQVLRDGVILRESRQNTTNATPGLLFNSDYETNTFSLTDTPSAGSHTYSTQVYCTTDNGYTKGRTLFALETKR